MNCNCKEVLEDLLKEREPGASSAELMDYSYILGTSTKPGGYRSTSKVEYEIRGKKKKKVITLVHSFCPHCGKPAEEKTEPITTPETATGGEG